jgi:hypothetical protein
MKKQLHRSNMPPVQGAFKQLGLQLECSQGLPDFSLYTEQTKRKKYAVKATKKVLKTAIKYTKMEIIPNCHEKHQTFSSQGLQK